MYIETYYPMYFEKFFMIGENYLLFEENLIREYKINPNPELAEVLIKEFSSHFIKNTIPSVTLNEWINDRSKIALANPHDADFVFGLRGPGQRSVRELLYICMNSFCWNLILMKIDISSAYQKVADMFNTSADLVRIGFERKNHDFGERELCRFGLDLYLAIYQKNITSNHENAILSILKEDIHTQMIKDLNHHRAKYKHMSMT